MLLYFASLCRFWKPFHHLPVLRGFLWPGHFVEAVTFPSFEVVPAVAEVFPFFEVASVAVGAFPSFGAEKAVAASVEVAPYAQAAPAADCGQVLAEPVVQAGSVEQADRILVFAIAEAFAAGNYQKNFPCQSLSDG